jgi:hypothetical protein
LAELRRSFAAGFEQRFFAMGETIRGEIRDSFSVRTARANCLNKLPASDRADRDFIDAGPDAATTGRRATHLPLFDMQTAGCAANRPFASETTTNMMRRVMEWILTFATHLAANPESECQILNSTRNLCLLVVL